MAAVTSQTRTKTYIVEHLDPELGPWSTLEYLAIARESLGAGAAFCLSCVSKSLKVPVELQTAQAFHIEPRSVEEIYANEKGRVCLLDPAATVELSPLDGELFDVFLFGGILGDDPPRGNTKPVILVRDGSGLTYADRTSELRQKGFQRRRLGALQMTTDTAVRVTRMIIQDHLPLEKIPYVDYPDIRVDEHESTEMPFRYVKGRDGLPIMPDGMIDLIKKDSEKGFGELL